MAEKEVKLKGLVDGAIHDLFPKTNANRVMVDENTTLTEKLEELAKTSNQVCSDWDQNSPVIPSHIKNRTHYSEYAKDALLYENTIQFDSTYIAKLNDRIGLEEGKRYILTLNGKNYTLKCVSMTNGTTREKVGVSIGSLYPETSAVPNFVVHEYFEEEAESLGYSLYIRTLDSTLTEATFAVYSTTETVHKLDAKYLPDDIGNSPIKPFPVRQNANGEKVVLISDLEPYVVYVLETNQNNSGSTYFVTDMEMDTPIANLVETGDTFYFRPNNFEGVFQETGFIQGTIFTYSYRPGHITKQSDFENYVTFKNGKSYTPSSDYHPANKKYVDDTVSQKISEIVIPEPIQGNWNQNDPTADDYIKNRTHWVEVGGGGGNTLEWDGNTDGLASFSLDGSTMFYKVSDFFVSKDNLIGGAATISGTMDFTITEEAIMSEVGDGLELYMVTSGDSPLIVTVNQDFSMGDISIEKGTHFLSMGDSGYISKLTLLNPVFGEEIVHKIDPKFISIGGYGYDNSEVLFDQTVEFADMGDGMMGYVGTFPKALENKTYKVTYNGVSYDCVPFDPAGVGMLCALGNAGPLGGSDTGEPFLMQVMDEDGDGVIDFMIADFNGATSVAVKIEIVDLHTIDPKFLPGKVVYTYDESTDTVTDVNGNEVTVEQARKDAFNVAFFDGWFHWLPVGIDVTSGGCVVFAIWMNGNYTEVVIGDRPK